MLLAKPGGPDTSKASKGKAVKTFDPAQARGGFLYTATWAIVGEVGPCIIVPDKKKP